MADIIIKDQVYNEARILNKIKNGEDMGCDDFGGDCGDENDGYMDHNVVNEGDDQYYEDTDGVYENTIHSYDKSFAINHDSELPTTDIVEHHGGNNEVLDNDTSRDSTSHGKNVSLPVPDSTNRKPVKFETNKKTINSQPVQMKQRLNQTFSKNPPVNTTKDFLAGETYDAYYRRQKEIEKMSEFEKLPLSMRGYKGDGSEPSKLQYQMKQAYKDDIGKVLYYDPKFKKKLKRKQ